MLPLAIDHVQRNTKRLIHGPVPEVPRKRLVRRPRP
jgi:hypothetical protein